jgi:hypothetical protein
VLVAAALELFEEDVGDAVDDVARGSRRAARRKSSSSCRPVDAETAPQRDPSGSATVAV